MTWTDTQVALLDALQAYVSAETASAICGDAIEGQWRKADRLHGELLKAALVCGYEPGGKDRHLSTVDFATKRAALIANMLPAHVAEAKRGDA